jgi:hypothetical protein
LEEFLNQEHFLRRARQMKHAREKSNGMKRHMLLLPVFLVVVITLVFTMPGTASAWETIELDEAQVFIEWNSTDDDYGIQFFWDGEPWRRMRVRNHRGKKVLDVQTRKNVRQQGLTEGFFESAEPTTDELSMEEFLERFPEGEYTFRGTSTERDRLVGEAEFTHTLPVPPENISPVEDAEVSYMGFQVSFDAVTEDTDGNPIDIEYYEVVVEKEDDDPILQVYSVILRPDQNVVDVPAQFLEPDTEYKVEVIAVEESGNKTITEVGGIMTDSP